MQESSDRVQVPDRTSELPSSAPAPPAFSAVSETSGASEASRLSGEKLCGPLLLIMLFCGIVLGGMLTLGSLTASVADGLFALTVLVVYAILGTLVLLLVPLFRSREYRIAAAGLLVLALLLRLSLFDHVSGDYTLFLAEWTELMRNMTVRQALVTPIGNYNIPYLYMLLLVSRLPFYDLYCIKLFSVAADVAAAFAVAKLVSLITKKQAVLLLAFAAALLAPTIWLNSAYWGQCDGVYAAFGLLGLYCCLSGKPKTGVLLFSFSFAFKLQAIFLLPMLVFLLVTDHVRLRQLLLFPAGFVGLMLPALLAGRGLYDTFSIYYSQTQSYPYLSLNAPSFWSMIDNSFYSDLSPVPVLLAAIVTMLVIWLLLRRFRLLDTGLLLHTALLFCLMIPWLLPEMHERYFYLAELLSIVCAGIRPRELPVCLVLLGGDFLVYAYYLFGGMPILSMQWVAVLYGLTIVWLLFHCLFRLYGRSDFSIYIKGGNNHGKA